MYLCPKEPHSPALFCLKSGWSTLLDEATETAFLRSWFGGIPPRNGLCMDESSCSSETDEGGCWDVVASMRGVNLPKQFPMVKCEDLGNGLAVVIQVENL